MGWQDSLDTQDMDIISAVLERFCSAHGLFGQSEREGVAIRLISLFEGGFRTEEALALALQKLSFSDEGWPVPADKVDQV